MTSRWVLRRLNFADSNVSGEVRRRRSLIAERMASLDLTSRRAGKRPSLDRPEDGVEELVVRSGNYLGTSSSLGPASECRPTSTRHPSGPARPSGRQQARSPSVTSANRGLRLPSVRKARTPSRRALRMETTMPQLEIDTLTARTLEFAAPMAHLTPGQVVARLVERASLPTPNEEVSRSDVRKQGRSQRYRHAEGRNQTASVKFGTKSPRHRPAAATTRPKDLPSIRGAPTGKHFTLRRRVPRMTAASTATRADEPVLSRPPTDQSSPSHPARGSSEGAASD